MTFIDFNFNLIKTAALLMFFIVPNTPVYSTSTIDYNRERARSYTSQTMKLMDDQL